MDNTILTIFQLAAASIIVWGIKLQFQMQTAITKLQVIQDHIIARIEKLENR